MPTEVTPDNSPLEFLAGCYRFYGMRRVISRGLFIRFQPNRSPDAKLARLGPFGYFPI